MDVLQLIEDANEPQSPKRSESPLALVKKGLEAVDQTLQAIAETQDVQTELLKDVAQHLVVTLEDTAFIRGHTNELVRQVGQAQQTQEPTPVAQPLRTRLRLLAAEGATWPVILLCVACLGLGAWLRWYAVGTSVEHRLMGEVDCILVTHQAKLPVEVLAQLEQAYRGQQVQTLSKRKGKGCF